MPIQYCFIIIYDFAIFRKLTNCIILITYYFPTFICIPFRIKGYSHSISDRTLIKERIRVISKMRIISFISQFYNEVSSIFMVKQT